jgi:hypothetical protein
MRTAHFWEIIERSKRGAGSADEQAEKLVGVRSKLPPKEIQSFERIFTRFRRAAYRWDLWGVAYLLCGGCDDDDFDYFRAWLIGRGQRFYEDAMKEPESVARKITENDHAEAEFLLNAASKAYEKQSGHEMPPLNVRFPKEPLGRKWTEEELPMLFPIAHKKEGICG